MILRIFRHAEGVPGYDMFTISGLRVTVAGRKVISGLDLAIRGGEVHAIMGPNGAGKTSLAQALMGNPSVKAEGSAKISGIEMLGLAADERARHGMFLAFQNPEEIEGVKVSNLVRKALSARRGGSPQDMDQMVAMHEGLVSSAKKLGMPKESVSRDVNVGFSGGEKKRLEALQMIALEPGVVILDEIDSGLDVDGVRLIAKAINGMRDDRRCFLIITHYPRILRHVRPDRVHVLCGGRIVASGGPEVAQEIEEKGYSAYACGTAGGD
jgi:Fe-S cluster assembly ATP-binding protein